MKQPLVTIAIPTYGRQDKLQQTIVSVLNQTYGELEVIVSDNATPGDDKKRLAEHFRYDQRIRFLFQDTNLGPTRNFNLLKEQATGDFFMWLGDDDYLDLDFVEKAVLFLQENPSYSLVSGQPHFIENTFCYQARSMNIEMASPTIRCQTYYCTVTHNSIFYGLMRIENIRGIEMDNHLAGDWIWVARQVFLGKIKTLETTRLFRHVSGGNNEVYARILGRSLIHTIIPNVSIGYYATRDVLTHDVYTTLSEWERRMQAFSLGGRLLTRPLFFKQIILFLLAKTVSPETYNAIRKTKQKWMGRG